MYYIISKKNKKTISQTIGIIVQVLVCIVIIRKLDTSIFTFIIMIIASGIVFIIRGVIEVYIFHWYDN